MKALVTKLLIQTALPSTLVQLLACLSQASSKHTLCEGKRGGLKRQVGPDEIYLRLVRKLVIITARSLFIVLKGSL